MATINQDPAGQASVTLSGISFGGSAPEPPGPTIPTTGQIWPLGVSPS
jgi:hypothetical protein